MLNDDSGAWVWVADVGATKIRHCRVTADARILEESTIPTQAYADPQAWLETAALMWEDNRTSPQPLAIGFAVPAVIGECGELVEVPLIPSWSGYPLRERAEELFGVPVGVEWDSRCALLGELWAADTPLPNALMLSVGTGIGGALVVDGVVLRGAHGLAGMPGLRIREATVEDFASGPAIAAALGVLTGFDALRLRQGGDLDARHAFDVARSALAETIAQVTSVVDVNEVIVAGGFGVAAFDYLVPSPVEIEGFSMAKSRQGKIRVTAARCGTDAPVLGAARVALTLVEDQDDTGRGAQL